MCKTRFLCSVIRALRSYAPLNIAIKSLSMFNYLHIFNANGIKLNECDLHEVKICCTQFSCPATDALQKYVLLDFVSKQPWVYSESQSQWQSFSLIYVV